MYQLELVKSFKRDLKLAKKRGLSLEKLDQVVASLVREGKVSQANKPHRLKGKYSGLWECHIQPDWLLIWDQDEEIKLISLIRTGTHSDLF